MTAPATIDSQDLSDLLGSAVPPRVLDVRTPAEFETAHIAGAYNVPLDLLREHRHEIIKHLDDHVVLVCRSGRRAAQAEDTLRKAGLDNVPPPPPSRCCAGARMSSRPTARTACPS